MTKSYKVKLPRAGGYQWVPARDVDPLELSRFIRETAGAAVDENNTPIGETLAFLVRHFKGFNDKAIDFLYHRNLLGPFFAQPLKTTTTRK